MATISSPGLSSNLDVKGIVSQLVALEKQPLTALKTQATTTNAKISAFGQIKSLVSTLGDAASKLSSVTGWNAVSATSSDTSAATVSAIGGTATTSFSLEVQSLAKAQATSSAAVTPSGSAVGAGTLKLEIGKWSGSTFTAGTGTSASITISATDTVSDVASKINGTNMGVSATVLTDASGQRLLLQSKTTGASAGFNLSVSSDSDGDATDSAGLSRLVVGSTTSQAAADAQATINGIAVTSSTNVFDNTVAGLTITALKVTSSAVSVNVATDTSTVKTNIDTFVKAYNAVNQALSDITKYDPVKKQGALLQGDTTALALQSNLRTALQTVSGASSVYSRLADVGITQALGGDLEVNSTKLNTALTNNFSEVKAMFRNSTSGSTQGVMATFNNSVKNMLSSTGFFETKKNVLNAALKANDKNQAAVNDRASRVEADLYTRYSTLDAKMSSLNALNAYIGQQVTTWNKSS